MSGSSIAYHLRENKAVERNLFIDQLAIIGRAYNISDYTYIGFGGPFLEDIKAIHAALRITRMISIDKSSNVIKRQKFNFPAKYVQFVESLSGDFISEHDFSTPTIFWLDYTAPAALKEQITEFRNLVSKLALNDVVKLTINANPSTLGGSKTGPELHEERLDILRMRLDDYCPSNLCPSGVTQKNYPKLLLDAVRKSINSLSARTGNEYFQIISSFTYADGGHKMLTVTGIILDGTNDAGLKNFLDSSRIKHWPMHNISWASPIEISVPTLSAKERMLLDSHLPFKKKPRGKSVGAKLVNVLGHIPGEEAKRNEVEQKLENYAKYYRSYPLFSRVVL